MAERFDQGGPEGPQPLIREAPAPEPFAIHALGPLRRATEAISIETEAPKALCAGSVLAAASLAVQGLRDVETLGGPRPLSLFLLTVAESGERKSTADRLAMQGVRSFEASLRPGYDDALEAFRRDQAIWEKRKAAILRGLTATRPRQRPTSLRWAECQSRPYDRPS